MFDFIKRLFCRHNWIVTFHQGIFFEYECTKCGAQKFTEEWPKQSTE